MAENVERSPTLFGEIDGLEPIEIGFAIVFVVVKNIGLGTIILWIVQLF